MGVKSRRVGEGAVVRGLGEIQTIAIMSSVGMGRWGGFWESLEVGKSAVEVREGLEEWKRVVLCLVL